MKGIPSLKVVFLSGFISAGLIQNAFATNTMVTDAIGTQQLWTFEEVLGKQRLISKINQVDGKGISQTWDVNGNLLTKTDEEGRTTSYTYNANNQLITMTEALGTAQERETQYEYVNSDVDLVTRKITPSIFAGQSKEVVSTYDANLNITATTINGFDSSGNTVTRTTTYSHDQFGKVTQVDGPRTDVNDVMTFEYYDCNTGAECGRLKKVTNALGHEYDFDSYDGAGRLLQSTNPNGVVTSYTYHPRGWLLSIVQTPSNGNARTTNFVYDNLGQITQVTFANGTQYSLSYDAAHDLREVSDNLGNRVEYTYDGKGNLTHQLTKDPDGTLVKSAITTHNIRNFLESVNSGGSITQVVNDAVGNQNSLTDPNQNPSTNHSYDELDRLTTTLDSLANTSTYEYNVADQLTTVIAPNGATTNYEYDDLGNHTQEVSPDRGVVTYTHDAAGNTTTVTDARGISTTYQYDALNRLISVSYPDATENISFSYDSTTDCGAGVGRLCAVTDETGQTKFEYDDWGNVTRQIKTELAATYITSYQYDAENRITQMTYPNGRVVDYTRDAVGRITSVDTTVPSGTTNVLNNRTYRADNTVTGLTLGNGLQETRAYDTQSRVTNITLGTIESRDYQYDANGNILEIDKPVEGRLYAYDVLDRLTSDQKLTNGSVNDYTYQYDENGNRTKRSNRNYQYQANSNILTKDGDVTITHDASGNTLNYLGSRTFTYNDAGRMRTVTKSGTLKATYRYNAFGQRTRKEIPNKNSQVFHYDLAGNLIMRSIQTGKPLEDYIWVDGELRQFTTLQGKNNGTINTEKVKTFLTPDHLLTPRLGTNDAQTLVWRWDSDAFNIKRPPNDFDGDGTKINLYVGFPGQYYDTESSLYYNWNRYYDRQSGRYVTSDPIGLVGGLNTFSYVLGNPLYYYDSTGEIFSPRDVIQIIGIIVGLGNMLNPPPPPTAPTPVEQPAPRVPGRQLPDPERSPRQEPQAPKPNEQQRPPSSPTVPPSIPSRGIPPSIVPPVMNPLFDPCLVFGWTSKQCIPPPSPC